MSASNGDKAPKLSYDCLKCPAYCCSYESIEVNKRDVHRLARHFGVDFETAAERYTKIVDGTPALRHQKDSTYGSVCMFLDTKTRRCTVYEARPALCRSFPETKRCGYYDFLKWERYRQDDPDFIPLDMT
jgi:Fe-S-cluster containining protein